MSKFTASEIRERLEHALGEKDLAAAKMVIRFALLDDVSIHKMTDLHFSLMLLLASPDKETRGRPKKPSAEFRNWYLNHACKIKSDIDGRSFSSTWEEYCSETRPKITADELWRCAGILLLMLKHEDRDAKFAVSTFKLSKSEIELYAVKK